MPRPPLTVYLGSNKLRTFSNLNAIAGYQRHAFNLAAYASASRALEFDVSENASRQTSFVIDDAALRVR
jgi:hypothetical protein